MIPTRVLIARATRALAAATLSCLCAARAFAASPAGEGVLSPHPRLEFADVVPPPVQITCPAPSADTALLAPPSLQVFWDGPDRGHRFSRMPFHYRYILLGPSSEFPVNAAVSDPESFRDYYAHHPLGPWTGWETASAHTPQAEFRNLIPYQEYLFAVIAVDRAGSYPPEFGLSTNMLHFVAGYPEPEDQASWSPVITVSGPGLRHRFPPDGFCVCEAAEIRTRMREHQQATFRWSAEPGFMCDSPRIRWYRWALDIEDIFDETPRLDEETDLRRWSLKSLDATSARLGPFAPGEVHRLYIEVEDDAGLMSLGIVRIEVLSAGSPRRIELAVEARRGGRSALSYSLPEPGSVEIGMFDVAGRRVATLENATQRAGSHVVTWDASRFGQGIYFCRLRFGSQTVTRPVRILE